MRHDIVIVGGGFAGIYAAWRLAGAGLSVSLVDQAWQLGGVLRSVEALGYLVDIGTHNFALRDESSELFYKDILRENLKVLETGAKGSTTGGAITTGFEMPDFSTSDPDLCRTALAEIKALDSVCVRQPQAYADWLVWRFGPTLASRMAPIVEKVIGGPLSGIDSSAAMALGMFARIKLGDDDEMAGLKAGSDFLDDRLGVTLALKSHKFQGMNSNSRPGYPREGALLAFCTAAVARLRELGVSIHLGAPVKVLASGSDYVSLTTGAGTSVCARHLFWTLPDPGLFELLGLGLDIRAAAWPVGVAVHVFETDVDNILGPDYLHDFTPDRASYRYARAGVYSGQVHSDGRTFVLAEIACHPSQVPAAASEAMADAAWRDLTASGFLRNGATWLQRTVLRYPVAYALPRLGWEDVIAQGDAAVAECSGRLLRIPFGHRGRDSFMRHFESHLAPKLTGGR